MNIQSEKSDVTYNSTRRIALVNLKKYFGSGEKWSSIANSNKIHNPNVIYAGQILKIDSHNGAVQQRVLPNGPNQHGPMQTSLVPSKTYIFVLADEVDPFRRKIVRRVLTSPKMAAEISQRLGKPLTVFPHPE